MRTTFEAAQAFIPRQYAKTPRPTAFVALFVIGAAMPRTKRANLRGSLSPLTSATRPEAAYSRGDALEKRRVMMEAWAGFLELGRVRRC
jgi:hypothetical protein